VVVGAERERSCATGIDGDQTDNACFNAGAAYVFRRSAGVWAQQAYLKASNTDAGDWFGTSVAVSGDTAVVGAYREDSCATGVDGKQTNGCNSAGAAYVFRRSAGVWAQEAYLKASNSEADDRFGSSVALSGDTVVVGAGLEDSCANGVDGNQMSNACKDAGAAYVASFLRVKAPKFSKPGGTYNDSIRVELTSDTSGAEICYTKNGSSPTQSNGICGNNGLSIFIETTQTIKARAFKSGFSPSEERSEKYKISRG
jgi:hypothetical protein